MSSVNRWYNQRTLRERIAVLFCVLAVAIGIFWLALLDPSSGKERRLNRDLAFLTNRINEQQAQEMALLARRDNDPDREGKRRLSALQKNNDELHQQLKKEVVNLVASEQMADLLKDMLTQQEALQLLRLENLEPQQVAVAAVAADAARPGDDDKNDIDNRVKGASDSDVKDPLLYRHPLVLEFRGDYLTMLKYLRQLEQLPRALIWDGIEIESEEYPHARVRIQVHTLSLTEGWIGG